ILTFKGHFKDHILLDKTHILNLSFLVDDLQKRRGGVAGSYAYNLALLGHPAAVLATAGTHAAQYRDWPAAHGLDCHRLRRLRRGERGGGGGEIPAAPCLRESDRTGAGDAYRAGLVAGLLRGLDLEVAGRVASLAASYVVEQVGTIEHAYTAVEFSSRCREAFGIELPGEFWAR